MSPAAKPANPAPSSSSVVEVRDRHELGVRLAVHVDELGEEELDALRRRARRAARRRRVTSRWPWGSHIAARRRDRQWTARDRSAARRVCDVHIGVRDEAVTLRAVISTVFSTLEIDEVLAGIVDIATEATGSHACLIYLVDGDRLVLAAASPVHREFVGRIEMGFDEGLTGWAARHDRAALVRDGAMDDPRMRYFPELEEERWQSITAVPIPSRAGDVIGVIVLHAEAPREFTEDDVELLTHIGHAGRRRDRGRAALRRGALARDRADRAGRGLPAARRGDAPRAAPRGGDGRRAVAARRRSVPALPARGGRERAVAWSPPTRPARPGRGRRAARCCSSCSPRGRHGGTARDLWPEHRGRRRCSRRR